MKTNEFLRMIPTPQGITRRAVTILCTLLLFSQLSFAEDFSARHLGDYGNVTVMEVSGNYDAKNPDGSVNAAPRQAIAREFFRLHKDEYDFVVVFTNFDFKMPEAEVDGFYEGVKNDVKGVGREIFDNTALYGSARRLQGTIDMGNLAGKVSNPLDPGFETTLRVLVHEMQHRWGSYVRFKDTAVNASSALLGKDAAHWSYLLDTRGSVMYGSHWQDNGNGTFTALAERKYYSPLDLYLMGMIDKSKVPPILLIENPSIDPAKLPGPGTTISGSARYVNIDDIIAFEGERIPNAKDSQKQFKTAFIYAVSPNSFKDDDLYGIESIRNGYLTRFSILTDGKGLVQVASTPKDNLEVNPGVRPPSSTPRTLPPNIDNGVTWLMNRQLTDGSWTDYALTTERDTAETVTTLQHFPVATQSFQAGSAWLGSNSSANTDYLARRIEAAIQTGSDSSVLVQELLARRNRDGGWGSNRNFISSATDTALALKALAVVGYSDSSVTGQTIAYLQGAQNDDGGWSGDDAFSTIQPTAAVMNAFNFYRKNTTLESNLTQAVAFLALKQNADGGFGNSPSTVYDSALAVIALQTVGADKTVSGRGVTYILGQQSDNGAWFDSPFQTALAVRAVWAATVDSDLSIKAEDISIIPATVTSLPTNAVLSTTLWNLGRSDVPQATVAIYDGMVTPEKKVAEQIVAFPGQSPVTLTFSIPVTDSRGHVFHVVVDPDNQLAESNRNNNSALKPLMPEITYDFQVLASDITVTPNPSNIYQDVKISARVANRGTSDAYNVPVRIFIDQPGAPLEIATLTVDLPAGGSTVKETTWKTNLDGVNLPLTVQIDLNNTYTETGKDNNSAFVPLTVNASTLPNLSVSYRDMAITPCPAREGGNASIFVLVKNDGFSTAENVKVDVYKGTATNGGTLLGSRVIPIIGVGQSQRTSIDWTGIPVSGGQLITVQVDSDNIIQEIIKDDNFTFLNLDVLSLPDLAISASSITINPATPKSGDTVTIAVTVQNGGEQEARDVNVQVKEGGTVVGATVVPLLNGNSQATASISYANARQTGTHQLSVTVDPGNQVLEQSKGNNSAVKSFSIQDANLWLTEPYFSPNGDGIKDTTDFSFRLAAPAKVSVQAVNKRGIAVRTFSGGELDNTPGTTIAWDGKNDAGVIVGDGDYQFRVVSHANALLATLSIVVDNNQSPLADAIGTRYLSQNNMTCQVPVGFWEWGWFPQDSGVWFKNDYTMQNFPSGLYQMAPDGDDIRKITADDWSDSKNDYFVEMETVTLNNNGTKIAFVVWKYERSTNRYLGGIWEQAVDGSGRRELAGDMEMNIGKLKWSPDSKQVVFAYGPLSYWGYNAYELRIAHSELGSITIVDGGYPYWYNDGVFWSPDSRSLAYSINTHCNADKSYCHQDYETLKITDVNGTARVIHTSSNNIYSYANMRWLADGMLLAEEYPRYEKNRLLLFDTINQTPFRTVQDESEYPMNRPVFDIHPDHRSIALIFQQKSGTNVSRSLNMVGLDGSVVAVGDMGIAMQRYVDGPTDDSVAPVWSPAGGKLAYVERELRMPENMVYENLVIYDRASSDSKKHTIAVSKPPTFDNYSSNEPTFKVNKLLAWLSDKVSILIDTFDGFIAVNTDDGTISSALPIERGWNDPNVIVSPDQRYITYLQNADTSGSCAKHYGNDIWTISSLLNLTTDLRITKNKSVVKLKGIASDKNFAGYKLEYAEIKTPDSWNLIMPPSDVPVVNDTFTDWIPPQEGSYLVRLTVRDKAGNVATDRKRVAWGISTLVSGLYRDNEFIAPKNPGNPKQAVTLHYTAQDAVHLEFTVVNDKGKTIRSFAREHAGYAVDSILWDGKDEAGTFVPDGKYTIKLFDYEFGVEVDNTYPTVTVGFSGITYDYKQFNYFVKLTSSAADVRLKKWTIQVGTGENPQDWSTVASGTDNPTAYVEEYKNSQIAFLKLKRFRIVAEDFAGNQSIAVSPFVESKVVLAELADITNKYTFFMTDRDASASIEKGAESILRGFESLAMPTSKVLLQFSDGSGWKDVQEQVGGGQFSFSWQQPVNVTKPYALRFKVVTTDGAEFFSKTIQVNEEFVACVACPYDLFAKNNLFEKLQQLDVKVTAGTDKSLSQSYTGDNVPTGLFLLSKPDTPDETAGFSVLMKGTGVSGILYSYSKAFTKPTCEPPPDGGGGGDVGSDVLGGGGGAAVPFDVIYPQALACGKSSGEIQLPTERLPLVGAKRVAYLVKVGTTLQVIGEVDVTFEGPRRVSVDSSLFPSGIYPLSVIVTNTDNTQKQTDLGKVVVFDTDAPQAQLIQPSSPCPVRTVTPKGPRLGIDLSGSATDNIRVARYTLYYGIGENPTTWSHAMSMESDGVSKPLSGGGTFSGRLGTWDVSDIPGSVFSLKLEVMDAAGNKGCATGVVRVDREIKINGFSLTPLIFSPNTDGYLDAVTTGFSLDEPATADLSVFTIAKDAHGTDVPGAMQRHLQSGLNSTGGAASFNWNGMGDSSAVLPDNRYGVSLTVTDACGNTAAQWKAVDLDNTPPAISIVYPLPGNPLPPGVMIEIKGTATDPHFKSYLLEAGEGDTPTTWKTLASSDKPIFSAVIVPWNTFGLTNHWTLRLTAEDMVGNKKGVSSTIDLGIRKELVKSLDATPKFFSPNNDNKVETSLISYEVTDACNLKIDILDGNGQVVRTFTAETTATGNGSIVWDGKNSLGSNVPDGIYTIRLAASLAANQEVNQTESISLTVDTTSPAITIADLTDKSYLNRTELPISGTINDANLVGYNITIAGPSGTAVLDTGTQNRANYSFGRIADLFEDTYTLTVDSQDLGQNQGKLVRTVTIDRTAPKVTLDAPKNGEFYGNSKNVIDISGAIVEKNLERYSLRYGVGETPTEWMEIVGGDTVPTGSKLFLWKVGKDNGVADGIYTLSLYATDKDGLEGETKVKVVVDNTPPEVAITLPKEGAYLNKATDIKGTLADANLDKGLLELAEGGCVTATKWAVVKTITTSIQNGALDSWKLLPTDGEYCLRLSVVDKSANKNEIKTGFKIDSHPPSTPQLSGKTENKTTNSLSWTKSPESDAASYNVYRTGQKLNTAPITDLFYSDTGLKEGSYIYIVKAVDLAGNESDPSNTVTLKVDLVGPTVRISTPKDGSAISSLVDIKGTAYSQDDFKEYRVYIGQGSSPSSWALIRQSPLPIPFGLLAQWDTITNQEGSQYTLKLEGEDTSGNISTTQAIVTIDNTAPNAPVLITTVASSADVALTWNANTELDLAGYLLYRNDQLANVNGIVAGNLKPYLVTGTAYSDKTLPDGTYRYYLVAMDQAGNSSDQSNTLEVNIDTHPPHMTITTPTYGQRFEGKLMISAETPDNDICTVQFQYKLPQDSTWTNLGQPFVKSPYIAYFDPKGINLPVGDFQLRAQVIDQHNNDDKTPTIVTVTYADLTPPDVPTGLAAKVTGADVNLTWTAASETGVSYNIYRWNAGEKSIVNSVPVNKASYVDGGVPDGTYQYKITALDVAGNESKASGQVTAKIYAPIIIQPFTPVKEPALNLTGNGVDPGTPVQITITLPSGATSSVTVTADSADSAGAFRLEGITLVLGENRFEALATDSAGNISRISETIIVVYDLPPAAPTGLTATVQDYDVSLAWNDNSEPDIIGYTLMRDGEKVNNSMEVTGGQATASYQSYNSMPQNAIDVNNGTYWGSPYGNGTFTPVWWQMSLPAPELIDRVEIDWRLGDWDYTNDRYSILAGKDYEVQAWSGYNWVTLKKVEDNEQQYNTIDISPTYRTDKIRIVISSTTDPNYSKYVRIDEIRFRMDNLLSSSEYTDSGLLDHRYSYAVTAVDKFGFESGPSTPVTATVGDVEPPGPPLDPVATVQASDVVLSWSPPVPVVSDLAEYHIYREAPSGWVDIGAASPSAPAYTDQYLANGTYRYRVTATDFVGNESSPSNEVEAIVLIAPPPVTTKLTVSAPASGGALDLAWHSPAGNNQYSYVVYRSMNEVGPFNRVTASSIYGETFQDNGLINGTAYYYRVTAMDDIGNEGAPSNTASGVPRDMTTVQPLILWPTVAGSQFVVRQNGVTVGGFAEPASQVDIMRDGSSLGSVTASSHDVQTDTSIAISAYSAALSPGRETLAIVDYSGQLLLRNQNNATTVSVSADGFNRFTSDMLQWSPNGRFLLVSAYDYSWRSTIVLYDRELDQVRRLTDETIMYEWDASWSPGGDAIVFVGQDNNEVRGIWKAQIETTSIVLLVSNANARYPRLSPAGDRVAYFDDSSLYLFTIADSSITLLDDNTDWWMSTWSPDGSKLAFISYRDGGNGECYVFSTATGSSTRLTTNGPDGYYAAWSPDSNQLAYISWGDSGEGVHIVQSDSMDRQVSLSSNSIYGLEWRKNGELLYIDTTGIHSISLAGTFNLPNAQLVPGENHFVAISTDTSGNRSAASDSITVVFDTGHLPDLAITGSDITLFPPYPKPGDDVLVTARIHNSTDNAVDNTKAELYLWDGSNAVTTLASETISHIDPNGEGTISARFNAGTTGGIRTIIAVADPDNLIQELLETNNYASKDLIITDQEKVTLNSSLNAVQYAANQDLYAALKLRNSGLPKTGMLYAAVEDAAGSPVKILTSQAIELPYGADVSLAYTWNSSTTYSGAYRLHATISEGASVLAEDVTPFTIMSDLRVTAGIVTDRQQYGARQDVGMAVSFRNIGVNCLIPQLRARVRVLGPQNTELFSVEQTAANLMPGASGSLPYTWNTGLTVPGQFTAALDVFAGNKLVASSSANFNIIPSVSIGGSITTDPAVALIGNSFTANYTLTNNGNAGTSGTAVVSLVDPETTTVVATSEQPAIIPMGGAVSGSVSFTTEGLKLKNYLLNLNFLSQGNSTVIATTPLSVKDGTPPLLTVSTLADGSLTTNSVLNIAGTVTDNVGVKELLINGVPVPFGPYGTFSHALLLKPGENKVVVTAADQAGNPASDSRTINLDQKAPVLVVTSPADNSKTNKQYIDVTGHVDEPCIVEVRLKGVLQPVTMDGNNFTALVALLPGPEANTIFITATNLAMKSSSDKRSVYYDDQAPALDITDPGQDIRTNQANLTIRGTASDLYGYGVTVSLEVGGQKFTPPLIDGKFEQAVTFTAEDTYQIVATATNEMDTSTSVPRNVIYDMTPPTGSIAINAGATTTNSTQVTLTLAASDASGVSMMSFSNDNSTWSDPETYATTRGWFLSSGDGAKQVNVQYQDLAGNWSLPASAIKADIMLDTTPPIVSATPPGGIYNTTQTVQLTVNEPATIYGTTDGSVPTTSSAVYSGPLTIASSTTLSCLAIDSAGNPGTHPENYIIDTIPPVLNVSTLPDGSYTNNEIQNVSGTVTDNIGVKELLVNGAPAPFDSEGKFSQVLILKPGENQVTVYAADLANNPVSDIRIINLDQKAPLLTITAPADNIKTNMPLVDVTGYVVDESNFVVEVSLKRVPQAVTRDGNNFTATVALVPGIEGNTIDISATDLVHNSTSDKRSVYYDDRSPGLAITVPDKDIRTNLANLTIHGTASDPYGFGVTVGLDMNGQKFTPPLIDGNFEQAVTFATEGIYNIAATATNEANNSTSVPRNVIYDVTPPALAINPVASPTTDNSQTLSGTMESGLVVTVTSSTAAIGTVTYPTATTWQVPVSSLTAGSNIITASVIDNANNPSTASKEIVYTVSTSSAIFSAAIFGNTKVTMTGGSYTDSCINCLSGWIKGKYRNGDVGTNSLQTCSIQMSGGIQVYGKAWVGHDGNSATGVCMSGGSSVSGGSNSLSVAKDMTPKTDPSGGVSIGAIKLSGHGTKTLAAGNYRASSVALSGGSTLTLNGPLTLHIDGNLSLSGNSTIVIASGAVTIYQNGQKLDISGGGIVNTCKAPANLTIYGTAGLQTMNLSGGSDLHALVYAPTAAVKLSGGQNTFGSIIGNTVDISGGSSVHYDESLRN